MKEIADISFFNSLARPTFIGNRIERNYDEIIPSIKSDVDSSSAWLKEHRKDYNPKSYSNDYERLMHSPEYSGKFPGFHRSVGGSTISSLLGLSGWDTPTSTWAKMTGLKKSSKPSGDMLLGHLFEDDVADEYGKRHPNYKIAHNNPYYNPEQALFIRHPDLPIITGQPDRLIFDDNGNLVSGLEIKTSGEDGLWEGNSKKPYTIPINYAMQSLLYSYLTDPDNKGADKPKWRLINWALDKKNKGENGYTSPLYKQEFVIPFDSDAKGFVEEGINRASDFYKKNILGNTPPNHDYYPSIDKEFRDWCVGNITKEGEDVPLTGFKGHSPDEYYMEK